MKNLIIEGFTGCGKTYFAINEAKTLWPFAYLAPCRQLAYEVFIDYSNFDDSLSTGEVKIFGTGDFFGIYESLPIGLVKKYKTIIIDEAHFITDKERGGYLMSIIEEARKHHVNIFLVTATRNFGDLKSFEVMRLKPRIKPPAKKQISYEEYIARMQCGISTIEFTRYRGDANLSADTLPSHRLQLQLAFRSGEVRFITTTNRPLALNIPILSLKIH